MVKLGWLNQTGAGIRGDYLLGDQEVVAQSFSGADGSQEEDKDQIQEPPVGHQQPRNTKILPEAASVDTGGRTQSPQRRPSNPTPWTRLTLLGGFNAQFCSQARGRATTLAAVKQLCQNGSHEATCWLLDRKYDYKKTSLNDIVICKSRHHVCSKV